MREIPNFSHKSALFTLGLTLTVSILVTMFVHDGLYPAIFCLVVGVVAAGFMIGKGELDEETQTFVLVLPGFFAAGILWLQLIGLFLVLNEYAFDLDTGLLTPFVVFGGATALALPMAIRTARQTRERGFTRRKYIWRLFRLILILGALSLGITLFFYTFGESTGFFRHLEAEINLVLLILIVIALAPYLVMVGLEKVINERRASR